MDEVKEEIKEEVEDTVMDEVNNDAKDDILDDTNYENKDESMVTVEEKNAPEDSTEKSETKSKVETKSSVYDPEEEAKKNPWNYKEVDLKDEDNQESDSLFKKDDVNKQEPNSDSVDKKDFDNEQPIKEESEEKEKVPGVYKPAPVVKDEDSDDEYEPISDDSAPDDDDVEAVLGFGLMRKKTFKPKRRKINTEMLSTKAVYITLASGQRVKKFTNQANQKFVPRKPWIPYRSQVSVAQVCKYLETKDVVILSSPALRHKCKDRTYFDSIARPLLRRANPDTHPLVLDTLIRAKWFEIMNIEDEDVGPEKQEGGVKRKLSSMGPACSGRVKRIKLNVKKNTM